VPDILYRAKSQVITIDGAMGTMLHRMGLPPGESPELLNVTAPEMIAEVHSLYATAGALAISTNTFGGSRPKLADWGLGDQVVEINRAAVRIAREVGAQHILADVGPTGLVMEPMGPATYDEVYAAFAEQIAALASMEPDAIFMETFTDLAEARVALLAAREVCDLPVFVSLSYGLTGRTELSGTDPATAAVVLEACGASAIGMNCGLGPEQMLPLVEQLVAATSLPVIVQPNAGMPRLVDGKTTFPGTPDEMAEYAVRFADLGAAFVGSCCGSTPAFTGAIAFEMGDRPPRAHGPVTGRGVTLASARATVRIGGGAPLAIIGERINPTGKKALAESLRAGSMSTVRDFAVAQQHAGADLLDVNVGAAGVDATVALPLAVSTLVPLTDLPLVLDTTDPVALEAALRVYPGRALINSVNGGADSMDAVLPLAVRYGAAVLVLALDDDGIPATVDGRLAIVERVRAAAHKAGLNDDDLVVDTLVMTAAAEPGSPSVTLEAVFAVASRMGLATALGVSNVSHGLPGRADLNAAFLALARDAGLSAAIFDPAAPRDGGSDAARDVLLGRDERYDRWLAAAALAAGSPGGSGSAAGATAAAPADPAERLGRAIDNGDTDAAPGLVDHLIAGGMSPAATIGAVMTPAIQRLGDAYGRGEVFLPQMMAAAEAMKAGVARAKERMEPGEAVAAGVVVFATVKGDIHSIGKDICVSLLESQGFEVDDLGVDAPVDRVVEAAAGADAVCLSALMTTTLPAMEATVRALKDARASRPVFVGGAVVTPEWAASVGADGYAADAPGCVEAVRSRIETGRAEAS
jgi:5-methyltetrahydrofolate--homocysteine methyltransferase